MTASTGITTIGVTSEDVETAFRSAPDEVDVAALVSRTLPERGLDRMTKHGCESVLCPSALTAHI